MSIKEYQQTLTKQLNSASETASSATVLGIALGEERCLVHMKEVNEVIQTPKITLVSLTQPWFIGVANVRGNLYGITDLGVYLGGSPVPFNLKSRILLVAANYRINSGFLVSSMLGIRSLSDFELAESTDAAPCMGISGYYKDKEGRRWRELNLRELIHNEKFLQIAQ